MAVLIDQPPPPRRVAMLRRAGLVLAFLAILSLTELAMGRLPISKSHRILLWVSAVNSPENSQQLLDWYSFSHLIHGFLFYAAFAYLLRRLWPAPAWPARALFLTLLTETAWEILENTPYIINRYRTQTSSVDYRGDSILNSCSDLLCCTLGFALARRLPAWTIILVAVGLELFTAWMIRDNLTLNVIMILHPSAAIGRWQRGG